MIDIIPINDMILKQAAKLKYIVKDDAPNDFASLMSQGMKSMIIWSGASDKTIFKDPKVNYAFRALHDAAHIATRLGFTPIEEIELGRIQASKYSGIFADIIFIEVAGQAMEYLKTGNFPIDQAGYTLNALNLLKG